MQIFSKLLGCLLLLAAQLPGALIAHAGAAALSTPSVGIAGLPRQHFLTITTSVSTSESLDVLHVLAELAARWAQRRQ
jgi:hypothetical protein